MDYIMDAETREVVGRVSLAFGTLFTLPGGMVHRFVPEHQHTEDELDSYYSLPIINVEVVRP